MKKLSSAQARQESVVLNVSQKMEEQGREELHGMVQGWFDVQYHQFPGSLLLRFQFESEDALIAAEPELKHWQKRLRVALLKKGVVLKDKRRHLVFTLEGPAERFYQERV